jgi:hypothetical protein
MDWRPVVKIVGAAEGECAEMLIDPFLPAPDLLPAYPADTFMRFK